LKTRDLHLVLAGETEHHQAVALQLHRILSDKYSKVILSLQEALIHNPG
jgi:hypothetical protein